MTVISLRHKQKTIPKYPYLTTILGVVVDRTLVFTVATMITSYLRNICSLYW